MDARSDAIAHLGVTLGRLGFRVVVMEDGADVLEKLARAISSIGAGDDLLVHISGRLGDPSVLRPTEGWPLPMQAIGDVLAAHAPCQVSVVAELVHDSEAVMGGAEHLESVETALRARERGYTLLTAARPVSFPADPLAFTSLVLGLAASAADGQATLSSLWQRVAASAETPRVTQTYAFVLGKADPNLASSDPPPDLDAEIAAAMERRDWTRIIELRRERLASLSAARPRVRELVAIARIQQVELRDAEGAIDSLEQARAIDPGRVPVLQALRRGYETLGRWASAIEIAGVLGDLASSPVERAALRFAQARMALDHLQDEDRAATWLEQALTDDPTHGEACNALALLRTVTAAPEPLPNPPPHQPEPAPQPPPELPPEPAPVIASEPPASSLPVAGLGGPPFLNSTPPPPPTPAPEGQDSDGLNPALYEHAFAAAQRAGRTDAAYLAALSLEALGAALPEHQATIEQLRTVAPLRARGTLDAAAWELLRPADSDAILRDLFASVASAGIVVQTDQLVASGRLVTLDPATRLDGASTASAVRSFQWAARVLGVACPQLHAVDVVPGDIAAVRRHEPTTAVGPSIMSGRSAKDLAFLAGRHLTYYLPEHQMLVYFPTREELTRLFLACIQLARPGLPTDGEAARAVAAMAERLDAKMPSQHRSALRHAVQRLEARGGRFSLSAFARNAELMAARVGLLLCGDLATAMAIVRAESRSIAGVTPEATQRDLVAFCASPEHAALRERYAFTTPEVQPTAALRAS
jgi:tetratricopeptide (TPR) repeat protein